MKIHNNYNDQNRITAYHGDCIRLLEEIPNESVDLIITSPPYCMGKEYEDPSDDIESFKRQHEIIFPELYRVLKKSGSLCWQLFFYLL